MSFLENRHIRVLNISDRAPLEGAPRPSWHVAFAEYLGGLDCPLISEAAPYAPERAAECVHWLVAHALSLAFEDGAVSFNADASGSERVSEGASAGVGAGEGADVPVPATAAAIIEELARLCHITPSGRSPFTLLQAVARSIRQRLLPAALAADAAVAAAEGLPGGGATAGGEKGAARAAAAIELAGKNPQSSLARFSGMPALPPGTRRGRHVVASGGAGAGALDAAAFPLGFETGDSRIDAAAAVLRMLYVADLRELQDAVNEILISAQEFTADPRTDASLGQVGR